MHKSLLSIATVVTFCFSSVANADIVALYDYSDAMSVGQDVSGNGNTLNANGDAQIIDGKLVLSGQGSLTGNSNNIPLGDSSYTLASWVKAEDGSGVNADIISLGTLFSSSSSNGIRFDVTNGFRSYWWANDLMVANPH